MKMEDYATILWMLGGICGIVQEQSDTVRTYVNDAIKIIKDVLEKYEPGKRVNDGT